MLLQLIWRLCKNRNKVLKSNYLPKTQKDNTRFSARSKFGVLILYKDLARFLGTWAFYYSRYASLVLGFRVFERNDYRRCFFFISPEETIESDVKFFLNEFIKMSERVNETSDRVSSSHV